MELQSFFIINYSLITDNFFLCWISSGGEPQRRFSVPLARRQPSRCTHGGLKKTNWCQSPLGLSKRFICLDNWGGDRHLFIVRCLLCFTRRCFVNLRDFGFCFGCIVLHSLKLLYAHRINFLLEHPGCRRRRRALWR